MSQYSTIFHLHGSQKVKNSHTSLPQSKHSDASSKIVFICSSLLSTCLPNNTKSAPPFLEALYTTTKGHILNQVFFLVEERNNKSVCSRTHPSINTIKRTHEHKEFLKGVLGWSIFDRSMLTHCALTRVCAYNLCSFRIVSAIVTIHVLKKGVRRSRRDKQKGKLKYFPARFSEASA